MDRSRTLLAALLAFAATGLAAPAHAADLATLGCVEEKLDVSARELLLKDVERNLAESGTRATYDPMAVGGVREAAAACGAEHGWSTAAVTAARLYTIAKVGFPIAQRVLGERGFDASTLEELWLALPEDKRNRPLAGPDYEELVKAAVTDEAMQTRENAELVSEFFGFLSVMQYSSYDFSQA